MQAQDEERAPALARPPAIALGLVLLAAVAQWPLFDRTIVPMDEGHLAAVADWLLDGKRLYVDLHTGLFPGVYLAAAGLFALFGRDLVVTRIAAAAVNGVIVLTVWAVSRRLVSPRLAVVPPVLHVAWVIAAFPVLSMLNYSMLALALGLGALLLLLRLLERGRTADAVALGVTAAAAVMTKQNFGGLVVIALGLGLVWCRNDSALAGRGWLRTTAPIAAGGAVVVGAVAGFLIAQGAVGAWLDSTVLSLLGSQLRDFDNPIPPLLGAHPRDVRFVFLYTPPALFNALIHGEPIAGVPITDAVRSAAIRLSYGVPLLLLAGSLVVLARTRTAPPGPRRNSTRAVIVFAELFFLGIFPSAIWSHLAFVAPPVFLLAAIALDRVDARLAATTGRARLLLWTARGLGAGAALVVAIACVDVSRQIVRWSPYALEAERASMRVSARELALYRGAIDFVAGCAAPDEPIVALPDIPIVWFLTDRPNPSPYDLAIPGHVDGRVIVARMRAAGVRCAVVNTQTYPEFPPFRQLFPGVVRALERGFRTERVIDADGTRWLGLVAADSRAPDREP